MYSWADLTKMGTGDVVHHHTECDIFCCSSRETDLDWGRGGGADLDLKQGGGGWGQSQTGGGGTL